MHNKTKELTAYIDSSIFIGMHHIDDNVRVACKNFFVRKFQKMHLVKMSLEQTGRCDDIIWKYSSDDQKPYYPFMDALHSSMNIRGIPYNSEDFNVALKDARLQKLILPEKLTVAMALNGDGTLYTINQNILKIDDLPVLNPEIGDELYFPDRLETLYQKSLQLRIRCRGIIPPLVTPINKNGDVCEASVKKLINHVYPFSTALIPVLTSGEGWMLSQKQWCDMVDYTLKYCAGLQVFAGVEFPTTEEVIKYGLLAKEKGVYAIVMTTPFNKSITQKEISKHFFKILDRIDIPIFIYNEEGISGNHIELDTMLKICSSKRVVGIKEASGDVNYTNKLIQAVDVPVFQGWENLAFSTTDPEGYIFPLANLDPKICSDMFSSPSMEMQNNINLLCNQYDILDSAPHINIKKILKQQGIIETDLVTRETDV